MLMVLFYLKSSMERFIAEAQLLKAVKASYLKSSMERFIVASTKTSEWQHIFKIQYGEIYSRA